MTILKSESPILQRGDDVVFPAGLLSSAKTAAKEVGSTWVTTYNGGTLWPVVLCAEDGMPPGFMESRRTPKELPAILLGRHKYIWAHDQRLWEFNPNTDYLKDVQPYDQPEILPTDHDSVKVEKQRRRAFTQDALEFKDDKYWHNYIQNKSKSRKLEAQMQAEERAKQAKLTPKRKRSDDDSQASSSQKKRKKQRSLFTNDQLLTPDSISKKPKKFNFRSGEYAHLFARHDDEDDGFDEVVEEDDDDTSLFVKQNNVSATGSPAQKPGRRSNGKVRFTAPEMGPDMCRILIGAGTTGTIVPLQSLELSSYLYERQSFNADGENVVDLGEDPTASSLGLTESEFTKVHEFFYTRDIYPHVDELAGRSLGRKLEFAQNLGLAFITAGKIGCEALEETIKDKLLALWPYPTLAVCILATILCRMRLDVDSTKTQRFLKAWIIDLVAYDFWTLSKEQNGHLRKLMMEHADLRTVVWEKAKEHMETEVQGLKM